ncbi:hypothetical protein H0H81_008081 [Sphagnurus paluster]|uniref:INO80 complex subunit B-like conserved region domain-containing protein n=1 Tax=Sphagnurus paluster TaxID=117069 RepID=A0A9P7FQ43_9AGAR|nr:hypothetical protein H0H81_008081 [Sphagnurus paluster]
MPVTTRTRRALALHADMMMDSDVDMEADRDEEASNIDVEAVADGDEEDVESEDEERDEEEDEIVQSEEGEAPKASGSRLKIRLKMPAAILTRHESPVVESEDSMSDSQPSTSTRPMTARQAVLASVVDSSHVSLGGSRQKKAPLNETELALRREETARKRRNLTEKKLEDEKAETINRLLKKQSRPRTKRTTAQRENMDDVAPPSSLAGTRSNSTSTYNPSTRKKTKKPSGEEEEGDDEDGMDVAEAEEEELPEREVPVPTMYRWVSTSRIPAQVEGTGENEKPEPQMRLAFAVPVSVLPPSPPDAMEAESTAKSTLVRPTTCGVPGCEKPFKYRLVKDWTRGACGMLCLKALEAGMGTV